MSRVEQVDAFQRRHPWVGYPIALVYKFVDDQGSYLSALIAYYGFVSLFPLLLLLTSLLGFVLRDNPDLQQRVVSSALNQIPVVGRDLSAPGSLGGRGTGLVVGILGSLYGGLGVAQAFQNAMNVSWAVPKNSRPNPFKARGRSLLLLATVGVGILATTVVAGASSADRVFGVDLGLGLKIAAVAVTVVLNLGLFLLAFRLATAVTLPWRTLLPGAVGAAVGWEVLQKLGGIYVRHVTTSTSAADSASTTNQTFAVVLGLVAFLYVASIVVVLSVEANVVRAKRLYPRALLTPFTDAVDLTAGDETAYGDAARSMRNKGFEEIEVRFDKPPDGAC